MNHLSYDANEDSNKLAYRVLKSTTVQAPIDNLSFMIPDSTPSGGIYAVDTAELFSALEGNTSQDKRSLKFLLTTMELHHDVKLYNLHNAGNDAHVRYFPCPPPFLSAL